jgi:hypothetical protein
MDLSGVGERVYLPNAAERLASLHAIEWAEGWQYATSWRFVRGLWTDEQRAAARREPPAELLIPPTDSGEWEANGNIGQLSHRGRTWDVLVPAWCHDESVVMQKVYWRRPGWNRPPWHHRSRISVERESVHL